MANKSLAKDSQEAIKAVVQILSIGCNENEISTILDPRSADPEYWSGSGFFIKIGKKTGYILTNSHVVRNAKTIEIRSILTSEEKFKCSLVGLVKNFEPDLALLKLHPHELKRFKEMIGTSMPYLELADSNEVKRGTEVKAIGYPLGMDEPNISGGEISNFIGGDEYVTERLVTDAAINPGNSGGPSIIEGKKVIGLNTSIIQDSNNIGFITPINFAKIIIENFLEKKEINFTELGAGFQKNSSIVSKYFGQEKPEGVLLTRVLKGGMCDKAGLKQWDIITKINDFKFDRHGIAEIKNSFRHRFIFDIVRLIPLGKKVEIEYVRDGVSAKTEVVATFTPKRGIQSIPLIKNRKFILFQGLLLQNLSLELMTAFTQLAPEYAFFFFRQKLSSDKCVVITKIEDEGLAKEMGLSVGQAIYKVNGQKVTSLSSFKKKIMLALQNADKEVIIETLDGAIGVFPVPEDIKIESAI